MSIGSLRNLINLPAYLMADGKLQIKLFEFA